MVKKLQLKSLNDLKKNNNQIVKFILDDIKKDLIDLKVFHDCFRSEKKKIASNFKIDKLIQKLLANDLAFVWISRKAKRCK